MPEPDFQKLREYTRKLMTSGRPRKLKRKIILQGMENLSPDKQYVYFPNHTSHFDDVLVYAFLENNLPMPVTIAGRNLDVWPINKIVPISKWGVLFVDRKLAESGSREDKVRYSRELEERVKDSIVAGRSIMVFIDGSRRHPDEMMNIQQVKTGFLGYILSALKDERMVGREVHGVSAAVHYDKIIERDFFPAMRTAVELGKKLKMEKIGKFAYYSIDLSAYFSRYLSSCLGSNPGNMYVRLGEPFPLSQFAQVNNSRGPPKKALAERITKEVKSLYASLVSDCKKNNLRDAVEMPL